MGRWNPDDYLAMVEELEDARCTVLLEMISDHMSLDGRCYCCETQVDVGWLCGECIELGCAETNRGVPTASTLPPGRVGGTPSEGAA
jgi:hypothetical protein